MDKLKAYTTLRNNSRDRWTPAVPAHHGTLIPGLRMSFLFALLSFAFLTTATYAQEIFATGVVYVESNIPTPNSNSILAYRWMGAGNLQPLPGSPIATGGAGGGVAAGELDSDQNIVVSP